MSNTGYGISPSFEGDTNVNVSEVASTTRTAKIVLVDDEISVFVNEHGQTTPMLIVGRCKLDSTEYAALFDTTTFKCYAVEVIREKGQIKYFKDLDGIGQDEEWAVVSNFFLDNNVYERNRIVNWIWNTKVASELGGGIPKTVMERWDKKKLKKRAK